MRACRRLALAVLGSALPAAAAAQVPVRGRVVAVENDQPLPGAAVYALTARHGGETDRHGRFVLWLRAFPDTLVARFLGRRPDTLVLVDSTAGEVTLRLAISPLPLAGVVVQGEPGRRADDAATPATWSLPAEAVAAVPAAVEADVFRGLALSPAVAYSTPLSSQPLVRGADPGAVGYRLDGFTLINPFHLGRIFSAVMPQAVQSATLAAAPFSEEFGDATSGVVDVHLREGGEEVRGGAQASFVSGAAWAGGALGRQRWFAAWRHGYYEHLPGPFQDVPYRLNDVYLRLALTPGTWGPLSVTAFWSGDRIFHRETENGVAWGNTLLGVRLPLTLGQAGRLELWAETTRFYEDVAGIQIRSWATDVVNRLETSAVGTKVEWTGSQSALAAGGEIRHRRLRNRITGGDLSAPGSDAAGLVGALFTTVSHRTGPLSARLGVRLDADGAVLAWQPRVRLGADLGRGWSAGLAAGRTARLYHVMPDYIPDIGEVLSVYDFWRPAGRSGTPLSTADHALIEVKRSAPRFAARASAFASRIRGAGEVRPSVTDTGVAAFFRFGRGRVWGLDAELSTTGARASLAVAYVLSWSRRAWDERHAAEIPWRYDRRHQSRAFFTWFTGRGWRFNVLAELLSPEPTTPAGSTLEQALLAPDGLHRRSRFPVMVPGPENSARGGWMGHLDLGIQKEIGGPERPVWRIGVSILNLGFTRIAPAMPEIDVGSQGWHVVYRPRIFLPPVPTLTFGFEF